MVSELEREEIEDLWESSNLSLSISGPEKKLKASPGITHACQVKLCLSHSSCEYMRLGNKEAESFLSPETHGTYLHKSRERSSLDRFSSTHERPNKLLQGRSVLYGRLGHRGTASYRQKYFLEYFLSGLLPSLRYASGILNAKRLLINN